MILIGKNGVRLYLPAIVIMSITSGGRERFEVRRGSEEAFVPSYSPFDFLETNALLGTGNWFALLSWWNVYKATKNKNKKPCFTGGQTCQVGSVGGGGAFVFFFWSNNDPENIKIFWEKNQTFLQEKWKEKILPKWKIWVCYAPKTGLFFVLFCFVFLPYGYMHSEYQRLLVTCMFPADFTH